jgi:SPP1 family predicted phage head-tail adaptor
MINPGNLNKKVMVHYPTIVEGARTPTGGVVVNWTSGSIWAEVEKRAGDEANNNGNITTVATYIFMVRANQNITEKCYITYQNKDYDIKFIGEPYKGLYKLDTSRRPNNKNA